MEVNINRILREIEKIADKMNSVQSDKEWQDLHKEKVCLSRDLEFLRGY